MSSVRGHQGPGITAAKLCTTKPWTYLVGYGVLEHLKWKMESFGSNGLEDPTLYCRRTPNKPSCSTFQEILKYVPISYMNRQRIVIIIIIIIIDIIIIIIIATITQRKTKHFMPRLTFFQSKNLLQMLIINPLIDYDRNTMHQLIYRTLCPRYCVTGKRLLVRPNLEMADMVHLKRHHKHKTQNDSPVHLY